MKQHEVRDLYDDGYAATYDQSYLFSERWRPKYDLERSLLDSLLRPDDRWLDVACGTGHFLSLYPSVERAGLDLSPAMLDQARRANPGVPFVEGDFLEPRPEWEGRWSFVSSMWYAYCLVESMSDLDRLIANLAAWTARDGGRCFLPLFHPEKACKIDLPYRQPDIFGGRFFITGVTWTWDLGDGKVHRNLVAPHVEYMVELFQRHFASVEVVTYTRDEVRTPFKAIVAADKLPDLP